MGYVTISAVDAMRARAAATRFRGLDRVVSGQAVEVTAELGRLVWTGPHADEIRPAVHGDLARVGLLRNGLLALASALDAHADWIDAERARLGRLEDQVRAWIRRNGDQPLAQQLASQRLPPPANTRWDALHRLIGPAAHTTSWTPAGIR